MQMELQAVVHVLLLLLWGRECPGQGNCMMVWSLAAEAVELQQLQICV